MDLEISIGAVMLIFSNSLYSLPNNNSPLASFTFVALNTFSKIAEASKPWL